MSDVSIEGMTDSAPYSSSSNIIWPALPNPDNAAVMSLMYQFEQSQWWSADRLLEMQMQQAGALLDFAYRTTSFYQQYYADIEIAREWTNN